MDALCAVGQGIEMLPRLERREQLSAIAGKEPRSA
jgi:hypothetical protein